MYALSALFVHTYIHSRLLTIQYVLIKSVFFVSAELHMRLSYRKHDHTVTIDMLIVFWGTCGVINVIRLNLSVTLDMFGLQYQQLHARQKTAPFYICNSFVKPLSILIIFVTHVLQ